MKYPKINTIWKRDKDNKFQIMEGHFSKEEFENIEQWHITEKIDGMNIRVIFEKDEMELWNVEFRGRTDKAQIPSFLLEFLESKFKPLKDTFEDKERNTRKVILYGEGYGAKIQKGGGDYRKDVSFILFDIWIDGWWLKPDDVEGIAMDLEIRYVPFLGVMSKRQAVEYLKSKPKSEIAEEEKVMEGIVARSYPLMLFRNKNPIIWKLKVKDYTRLEGD